MWNQIWVSPTFSLCMIESASLDIILREKEKDRVFNFNFKQIVETSLAIIIVDYWLVVYFLCHAWCRMVCMCNNFTFFVTLEYCNKIFILTVVVISGGEIVVGFLQVALGGPLWGFVTAKITLFCLSRVFNDALVEITITLASTYLTFYIGKSRLLQLMITELSF